MRRTLAAAAALIATVAVLVAVDAAPAAAHPRRTTYTVTSTTPAGPTPHFPAFDPTTGHVLVSNVAANTVTDLEIGTGLGLPYDRQGPAGAHRTERMLGPWTRLARVPRILPALDGVEGKLDAGGVVADVGCGAGVAVVALAQRFPRSHIHGYDISRHAIGRARQLVAAAMLDNVTLHLAGADTLPPEATFDLVLTLDCLHDMTKPTETMSAIRRSIRPDGTWLVKDIRCALGPRTTSPTPWPR